jgi:hypothetical protein
MKKLFINLFALLSLSTASLAQEESIPAPSDAEALNIFKTNKELHQLIKERTGYEFSKLKMVKANDWEKYWSKEGELRKYKWTMDVISKAYDLETPKDNDGTYNVYQVFINYRRSKCSMNGCLLTDNYTYENFSVGPAYTYGYKKFSKEEKMNLLLAYLKTNKPTCMGDIVTITNIEVDENYIDNNTGAKSQCVYFKAEGKIGIYNKDYSRLYDLKEFSNPMIRLYLAKKNNVWAGEKIEFEDGYQRNRFYQGNPQPLSEYYQPLKNAGFDAVYKKMATANPPIGMFEKLTERSNEFMNLFVSKAENIKVEDVWPFAAPEVLRAKRTDDEMREKINEAISISKSSTYIYVLTKSNLERYYYSCDGQTEIVECDVYYSGDVDTYKLADGIVKKRKPTSPSKKENFSIKWLYDESSKNWYIYDLGTPKFQ